MIFFEDFIKRIEEAEKEELHFQEEEVFGLNKKKKLGGYGIAIPLFLIAIYEIFVALYTTKYYIIAFSIFLFYFGFRQCKNMWVYRITVKTKEERLLFQTLDIDLKNIESAKLREARLGRKITPVLDFITKEKKQMIIPMYMDKQVFLVRILQKLLREKFSIKK